MFALHAWVGFHLAIVMSVILLTGTIATVSNEIDWLIYPEIRVSPGNQEIPLDEMVARVRAAAPDHRLMSITALEGDHLAYRAALFDGFGRRYFMHIDQWTGRITGTTHTLTVQRFFRDFHRYLFMPSVLGLPVVTAFAFVLAISLYTGLKTTRNWRTIALRIRRDKGLRILVGDFHKAIGLWSIWFFVLIIATSIWYLLEFGVIVGGSRLEPPRPALSVERVEAFDRIIDDAPAADVIAAAKRAFPHLEPSAIYFPISMRSTVRVLGRTDAVLARQRANAVILDPETLTPIAVQRSAEMSWLSWLNDIADPLHFGYFGGLWTKLIWCVFGLGMTGLSLTGVWLTAKRLRLSTLSRAQIATLPILLLGTIFALGWYSALEGPPLPRFEKSLGSAQDGDLRAELFLDRRRNGAWDGGVRILLTAPGRPTLTGAQLQVLAGDGRITSLSTKLPRIVGATTPITAHAQHDDLRSSRRISAKLTFRSGAVAAFSWQVPTISEPRNRHRYSIESFSRALGQQP